MKNISKDKFSKVFAIILGVFLLLYLLFQAYRNQEEKESKEHLKAYISNQISLYRSGETKTIDLSKIDLFSWDKLYIFGSYVSLDIIQERLDYSWNPSTSTMLGGGTSFTLFPFTYEGKVVQYVEYPLELGNFSEAGEKSNGYEPHEAIFVINEYGYILWVNQ